MTDASKKYECMPQSGQTKRDRAITEPQNAKKSAHMSNPKHAHRGTYRENLLGRPSVIGDRCAVCGRPATNNHHVIQKGMGGVNAREEALIPKITLCGSGTTGCHGLVHARKLHLQWADGLGGWCVFASSVPMDDELCWWEHSREYRPLKGWTLKCAEKEIYGRGKA